jgi:hypothetical protein
MDEQSELLVNLRVMFPLSGEVVQVTRRKRWKLQTAAKRILGNSWRVSKCYRSIKDSKQKIEIRYNASSKRAFYRGLQTCGSVWTCPVCSAKITEKRRVELTQAVEKWRDNNGSLVMVTLTLQHSREDDLKMLLTALKDSWRRLKSGRRWMSTREKYELSAYVSSTEVTHGGSGWHPHIHALFFSTLPESEFDIESFKAELTARYTALLEKHGRYASDYYGIDARLGDEFAGDYASKFGLEREMVKSISKHGKSGSSPFELLERYTDGDAQAGALFREYARAFYGVRQLTWSRGAREILELGEELEDEQIAAEEPEESELLITLDPEQFAKIARAELRGEVLEIASTGDACYLWRYLLEQVGISPPVE